LHLRLDHLCSLLGDLGNELDISSGKVETTEVLLDLSECRFESTSVFVWVID